MIHKLELKSFGGFHDTEVFFGEGYQCLPGPNESGKTTTIMCIRALLYGFSKDSLNRKLYSDDYEDYKPLQGRDFSAAMEIETSKGRFRIERQFHKENEHLTLINLDTKEIVEDESLYAFSAIPQPGSYFWGLSQDDFMRFFCMEDLQSTDALSVLKRIEESRDFLTKGNSSLRFADSYAYLDKRRREIGTVRAKKSPLGRHRDQIARYEADLADLRAESRELQDHRGKKMQMAEKLRSLQRERHLQTEKHQILPQLGEKLERATQLDQMLLENEKAIDHFEGKKTSKFSNKLGFAKGAGAITLFFLLATAIFVFFFQQEELAVLSLMAAALFAALSLLFFLWNRRTKKILRTYHNLYGERDELLAEKQALCSWLDPYVDEDIEMDTLRDSINRYARKLESIPEFGGELDQAIENIQRQLGFLEGKEREAEDLQKKMAQTERAYREERTSGEELENQLKIIDLTESVLKEVDSDGEEGFKQEILSDGEGILSVLSGGRYNSITFGKDQFIVSGNGQLSLRDTQLSRSTADLLVLSLRLAAVNQMDPHIPMVFDDGFVHMDKERRRMLVDYLKDMNRQILDFTTPLGKGE